MTANELADEVMEHYKAKAPRGFNVNWMKEAATMLRQQAKEIAMLKQIIDANNLSQNIGQFVKPIDEPVAMRYDFDGYGYKYIDSGSGSDWKTRGNGEFLYTKPFFSQKPVAMMVKIDGFDKPEFTTTCSSAALKHPNYTALYDHPPIAFAELKAKENRESAIYATGYWNGIQKAKEKNKTLDTRSYLIGRYDNLRELSDEEIYDCFKIPKDKRNTGQSDYNLIGCREVADAILRKANEK